MDKVEGNQPTIIAFLQKIMDEGHKGKHGMIVIHEAVEALANMNFEGTMKELKSLEGDLHSMVSETVFLAEKLIEWNTKTNHGETEGLDLNALSISTNDPAPPFNWKKEPKYADVETLGEILLDNQNYDLFERYRAMFTLRELQSEEAVVALARTFMVANFERCSPLLKHEVAFVLAQMPTVFKAAVPYILEAVNNEKEAPIVKHEALVSLGEMLDDEEPIKPFLRHHDDVVRESAEVAMHLYRERKG